MSTARWVSVGCIVLAIAATAVLLVIGPEEDSREVVVKENEGGASADQHPDQAAKAPAATHPVLAKAEESPGKSEAAGAVRPKPSEKKSSPSKVVTTGGLRPGQVPIGRSYQRSFPVSQLPRTQRRDYTIQPRQTIDFESQAYDQARYAAERAVRQYQQQTSGYLGANGLMWSR